MKINDKVFGAVLIVFSIAVLVYSRSLPVLPGYKYGAGFFPAFTSIFLLGSGLVLFFRNFRAKSALIKFGEWTKSPALVANISVIPLNLVFYMAFANLLGFVLTTTIMTTFTIWWLRRKLVSSFVVAGSTAILAYIFFAKIMLVPLPAGILGL
ncbi:MAG: tripartite tricarboxylate transporter TctB family protein [Synergistaceae bacterium]|jgi:putative tricarboxylic transport membrane protein|nr:tripartite tricarboxylate transporter TctB family protein [Synergistaceae bacterium]